MQALTLPARRGWHWLFDGFRIFRKSPLLLSILITAYWMMLLLINVFPGIGRMVSTLLVPVFSVSLMNACRMIEQGEPVKLPVIFSGFSENRRELLILGALYAGANVVLLGITALIDGGTLFAMYFLGYAPSQAERESSEFLYAAQLGLALFVPLTMAYWYAPVLVAWHRISAGKSIFFSLVACMRNWRAFLTYAVAIVFFCMIIPGLVLVAVTGMLSQVEGFFWFMLSAFAGLVLVPCIYASFFASYRDVFVAVDEDA